MKQIPSHSQNDFTDKESVSLIENTLAHHKRVMSKLYSSDKWPNIDGHIEVQDVNNILVGRSYVQVKTLPVNHNSLTRIKQIMLRLGKKSSRTINKNSNTTTSSRLHMS